MRDGNLRRVHVDFLLARQISVINDREKAEFKDDLHTMTTLKQTVPIILKYLLNPSTPVAKIAT
eukprot:935837-Ditylum_brightwellii.AAC.1